MISGDHKSGIFAYIHYNQLDPTYFIHALYITGHEKNLTIFNGKTYQQFPHGMLDVIIANCRGELNIPVFLDNGCTVSLIPKNYYNSHEILLKCQKMPFPSYMVIYIGSIYVKV